MRLIVCALGLTVWLVACDRGPVKVVSESMAPTLEPGDVVFQNPISDPQHEVRHGMILVYEHFEGMEYGEPGALYLFRAVGLAGDRISLLDDTLRVNGRVIPEPYARYEWPSGLGRSEVPPPKAQVSEMVVPEGTVFVLGDNRYNALDSRYHGPIPMDRVRAYVTPPDRRKAPGVEPSS